MGGGVHDEKRKGKTFVEGLKRGRILLEECEGKTMQISREREPGPETQPTVMSFSGGSKC